MPSSPPFASATANPANASAALCAGAKKDAPCWNRPPGVAHPGSPDDGAFLADLPERGSGEAIVRAASARRDLQVENASDDRETALTSPGKVGLAEPLFTVPRGTAGATFDIARDGRIFLRTRPRDGNAATFTLVANWPRLLEGPSR